MHADANIVIVLCANKSDLSQLQVVPTAEGKEFASKHGLQFVETSALTNAGVEGAFESLLRGRCRCQHPAAARCSRACLLLCVLSDARVRVHGNLAPGERSAVSSTSPHDHSHFATSPFRYLRAALQMQKSPLRNL